MTKILKDHDCQAAANNLSNLSNYETKFLPKLGEYLRLRAQNSAACGDYNDATESSQKRTIVMNEYRSRRKPPPLHEEVHEYSRMIQQRQDEWGQQLADFDAATNEHLQGLRQQQEHDLAEFDAEWEGPVQEKYRKPSAELIRQRTLEAEMIHRDQIELARFIHGGVKVMEQKELAQAQQQYIRAYKEARAQKTATHNTEMRRYCWQRECERLFLVRKIEKETLILSKRLNVLQEKPPNPEPFTGRVNTPVSSRPVVPTEIGCNPGAKLPRLIFEQTARPRKSTSRREASTQNTTARTGHVDAQSTNETDPVLADVIRESIEPSPP
jgi:hypothetical protein